MQKELIPLLDANGIDDNIVENDSILACATETRQRANTSSSRLSGKRNRLSDALAATVTLIASVVDKACSLDLVKIGVDKILADLSEIDGPDTYELLAA